MVICHSYVKLPEGKYYIRSVNNLGLTIIRTMTDPWSWYIYANIGGMLTLGVYMLTWILWVLE